MNGNRMERGKQTRLEEVDCEKATLTVLSAPQKKYRRRGSNSASTEQNMNVEEAIKVCKERGSISLARKTVNKSGSNSFLITVQLYIKTCYFNLLSYTLHF